MLLDFTINLARRAGTLLVAGLEHERSIELKGPFDLVTDADRASEALIVAAIHERFPDHGILAEEGNNLNEHAEYLWLIDPLDGTNNYAHGMPFFGVSLALTYQRTPVVGVVFDPLRNELFSAERGQGAFCNGQRLRVSRTPNLAASLVSTGFPYDYAVNPENNTRQFSLIQARTQGVRRPGAASLDLSYVAMGRFDAHWELRLKPWDVAAGALLITEAGGRLSTWNGAPWNPWSTDMIASNGLIHDEFIHVLGLS